MYLNIREHIKAFRYQPLDLDTGQLVKDCIWADDETGEYCVYATNEKGDLIIELSEKQPHIGGKLVKVIKIKEEIRKGRIKLIKVR